MIWQFSALNEKNTKECDTIYLQTPESLWPYYIHYKKMFSNTLHPPLHINPKNQWTTCQTKQQNNYKAHYWSAVDKWQPK